MLIITIALGIVLAVVILNYLPEIAVVTMWLLAIGIPLTIVGVIVLMVMA